MANNLDNGYNTIYNFEIDSPQDISLRLASNLKKRRLERGLSRGALSMMSGVPASTITKFEREGTISLVSFIAMAISLDSAEDVKKLLSEPVYRTMQQLETINRNKNRLRGRNKLMQR